MGNWLQQTDQRMQFATVMLSSVMFFICERRNLFSSTKSCFNFDDNTVISKSEYLL